MATIDTNQTQQIIDKLHDISGQRYYPAVSDYDHAYAKPWYWRQSYHKVRPTRFLFLKNFPRHFRSRLPPYSRSSAQNALIDVGTPAHYDHSSRISSAVEELLSSYENSEDAQPQQSSSQVQQQPSSQPQQPSQPQPQQAQPDQQQPATQQPPQSQPPPPSSQPQPPQPQPSQQVIRTPQMERLYLRTCQVLQNDYTSRLVYEGNPNELIYRRNTLENTSDQLRHVLSSAAGFDTELLTWLHNFICTPNPSHEHLIKIYHDVMQYLRLKVPGLIDKFYSPPKCTDNQTSSAPAAQNLPKLGRPSLNASQPQTPTTPTPSQQIPQLSLDQAHGLIDPIGNLLAIHKPRRLVNSPLFIVVPHGPNVSGQPTHTRLKFWNLLLGSLGKVITVNLNYKPHHTPREAVASIKQAVRDKIRESRKKFNETKAMVLVGFGYSSLIAAHCALESAGQIAAVVCLGFPLFTLNGPRGDLDDPLLDLTTPILFVIGQQATTTNMDEMERFREMMSRNESSLVVVGSANDNLVVSHEKKMADGITQSMVDRCIADEIFEFVSNVLHNSKEAPKPYMEYGY